MYKRKNGPNILIVGTPGTGKSKICQALMECVEMTYLNIADIIKDKKLFDEWDDELNCSIYNEKKLIKELNSYNLNDGGYLIEFHSCDIFDDDIIDHVIVLRTDIEILSKRLEHRKYSNEKITENIQCEIFQVILDDANEQFTSYKIKTFTSNTNDDIKHITESIIKLLNHTNDM